MKQVMKRLTALLLAGIMIISMIPELTVKAAGNANIQCVFKCGANVTGVLDITGTLTLTGTGSTYEGGSENNWINSFWYGDKDKDGFETYQERINRVVIGDGITSIGNYLFRACSSLNSVTIGKDVQTIGKYAFRDCDMLTSINIPGNVQVIDEYAFYYSGLNDVRLNKGLQYINKGAFEKTKITAVTIPENTINIEKCAFGDTVKNITISKGVSAIQAYAFLAENAYVDVLDDNVVLSRYAFGKGTTLKGNATSTAAKFVSDTNKTASYDGYYKFEVRPIKVSFAANGGTCKQQSMSAIPGKYYGTLPAPARKGYTFAGWYTSPAGGVKVSRQSKVANKNITLYAHWTKVKVAKAKKPGVKSTSKKKAKVTIKRVKNAYGYQICYSTKKNMSGAKKKVTKKLSKTLTGLKSKKKYYVKVRAFKKDSTGNRVYGKWSAVKAVKIK